MVGNLWARQNRRRFSVGCLNMAISKHPSNSHSWNTDTFTISSVMWSPQYLPCFIPGRLYLALFAHPSTAWQVLEFLLIIPGILCLAQKMPPLELGKLW
eukprot:CAMPEP_0117781884 /NCGR_PEP_ID=MMETSP0948-20121206/3114_1 /TAXON_ID=44440 /ORGANISM="Chattonella subsalsa, Strain CCMP2191" /LENGTH=98 /DNA_ID=CAMNT_0005610005 /DNA_START=125 /DNA_END=418 /DNA_ORIENTATION=-